MLHDTSMGTSTNVPPERLAIDARYVKHASTVGQLRLKCYITEWNAPPIWWELRRFFLWFNVSCEKMPRMITQNWKRWQSWVGAYTPHYNCLRASSDKRSRDERHYLKFADCPVASTLGLLILACERFKSCRPETFRPLMIQHLSDFAFPYFENGCFLIYVSPRVRKFIQRQPCVQTASSNSSSILTPSTPSRSLPAAMISFVASSALAVVWRHARKIWVHASSRSQSLSFCCI